MSLDHALRQLADAYCEGDGLALLFDYDGTLTPIVVHPDLAELSSDTRNILVGLASLPRVEVGLISGRSLADLKSLVPLPRVSYAGTCGLELELPDFSSVHGPALERRPILEQAAATLRQLASQFTEAWVEEKSIGITVHYRLVPRTETALLLQCVEFAMRSFEKLLTSVQISMAVEIIPDVDWNKGDAVRFIVERNRHRTLVLYAGNDTNDTDAVEWVNRRGGVSIGIGQKAPSTAQYCLDETDGLTLKLASLLEMLLATR